MKKTVVILLFITSILSGCKPSQYTFPNKNQSIEKIELLYHPHANNGNIGGPMETICTLEDDSVDVFMEKLYGLETNMCITPPPRGYGFHVARVVYQNGDVEIFGSRHIEFVEKGSEPKWIGEYSFDKKEFEELFFQYAETTDFQE